MDKKIAFIFPGQGAQYVGMGKDFYETFSSVRETFQEADEILGFSLTKLLFEGPGEELTLTKNSQVAIYVMSVALWRVLKEQMPEITPTAVAGLSLGEYTALTASERLSFEEGVKLVRARGLYMYEAGINHPGTMAVCLGMEPDVVRDAITSIEGVWVANLNCPGQVVISGTIEGVEKASGMLKEKGAKRVLPLDVSGAFHSGLMSEAQEKLREKIEQITLVESEIKLVMNVPGGFVSEGEIKELMISQVSSPVQWEKGVRQMEEKGIELFIEIGPGKTLSGMNRKIGVKGETLTLEKVEDLETLNSKVEHGIA
ncbi:ACP S-malonyltransferase [Candidatus Neptunochlamydia vexilliferae]|uniref:ACP S-malonyltransferase n=1 Tax=Candidatus Neptunichlamydia vexilliferae TaxID=1651774 RepID=UPI0018917549|nr:ACP S-malonyltransferase [Candidatus Neptunochlamydia vexilliferae]